MNSPTQDHDRDMVMNFKTIFAALAVIAFAFGMTQGQMPDSAHSIQSQSASDVADTVCSVNGAITHELSIIDSIAA